MSRFAVTLFLSATLLFACQPMVARMIVPLLGGAPAVWTLCSLCFQALVLGGYAYAHVVGSRLTVRTQVILQLALIAAAFLVLPVVVDESLVQALTAKSRPLGLLAVLLRSVGLPFFVLATTSPLLQRWFAEIGETDPYHLYAASNAGSMLSLLAYPFAIEPYLALAEQSRALQIGFIGYAVMVAACAFTAVRKRRAAAGPAETASALARRVDAGAAAGGATATGSPEPSTPATPGGAWRERLVWLGLAFAPSSLLLGATDFVATDIASVPLLWVLPLALYLASFIVAFAKKQVVSQSNASRALALFAAVVALTKLAEVFRPAWAIVGLHFGLLFIASVVCHRALAERRPHHTRLTGYYLVLSLGGVLGGAFNGLVAPVVFDDLYEYPIAISLVCLARAALVARDTRDAAEAPKTPALRRDLAFGLGLALITFVLVKIGQHTSARPSYSVLWMYVLPVLIAFAWSKRPVRYAVALGGILLVGTLHGGLTGNTTLKERDFFGVLKLRIHTTGEHLLLVSGSTLHGAQAMAPALKRVPLTYYFPTGPAGDVLGPLPGGLPESMRATLAAPAALAPPADATPRALRRVGVVGLGVGSLAAYARPGETWTFFELSPRVVEFATKHFTYLSSVPPGAAVAIETGDARLRLREGGAARFDVLVLDAFSSDAIPLHLMTREALAVYRRALVPGGLLLAHISNRHVLLEPVFAALAADARMLAIGRDEVDLPRAEQALQKKSSQWVVLSDSAGGLSAIRATNPGWRDLPPAGSQKVWTDDFANVLDAIHF